MWRQRLVHSSPRAGVGVGLGSSEARQRLPRRGHDVFQQGLPVLQQPLDGVGLKEIGIVFHAAEQPMRTIRHIECEIKLGRRMLNRESLLLAPAAHQPQRRHEKARRCAAAR